MDARPWSPLTWSHFKLLLRVEKETAREWYMREAVAFNWSVRALERGERYQAGKSEPV